MASRPPIVIWLMAGTRSVAPRAVTEEGGDGGARRSLAESAMSHGDASAARAPRHRSRSLIASTGETVGGSSISARSMSVAGSGSNTAPPIVSVATHGDHAPDSRTDVSKRKLIGAEVSAL